MKKSKIFSILFIIFLLLYIFISAYSYSNAIFNDITNSVFRLHVIANSDSEEDQNLKYKVRDSIILYMNTITKDAKSKDEAIQLAKSHMQDFYTVAKQTIIEIGEAKGKNWWCVMFPPLCFVDVSSGIVPDDSKKIIQENLSSEEYVLVSNFEKTDIRLKFKKIGLFKSL